PVSIITRHSSLPPSRNSDDLASRKRSQSSADCLEAAERTGGMPLSVGETWSGASADFWLSQCTAQEFQPRCTCPGGRMASKKERPTAAEKMPLETARELLRAPSSAVKRAAQ